MKARLDLDNPSIVQNHLSTQVPADFLSGPLDAPTGTPGSIRVESVNPVIFQGVMPPKRRHVAQYFFSPFRIGVLLLSSVLLKNNSSFPPVTLHGLCFAQMISHAEQCLSNIIPINTAVVLRSICLQDRGARVELGERQL